MRSRRAVAVALLAALVVGCGGGVTRRMVSDAVLRGHIQEAIAADRAMAAEMMERLMASDSTRSVAVERAFANPDGAREIMLAVARDRERFDGVVALAVQDTAMRDHALTLFRGMEMAGAR